MRASAEHNLGRVVRAEFLLLPSGNPLGKRKPSLGGQEKVRVSDLCLCSPCGATETPKRIQTSKRHQMNFCWNQSSFSASGSQQLLLLWRTR